MAQERPEDPVHYFLLPARTRAEVRAQNGLIAGQLG
jgi:hypothetical protein